MTNETTMTTADFTFPQWGAAMGEWGADLEHDDLMDADAYDRRRAERDGWRTDHWDGRW